MARENTYYVVLPENNGKRVGPPTICSTLYAAEQAVEESKEADEYGWYADQPIRQMSVSELAWLVAA